MINFNASIDDCSVCSDVANVIVLEKKDCGITPSDTWTSLCQAMDFFAHSLEPQFVEQMILDELSVVCNSLLCDRGCTTPLQYSSISIIRSVYCFGERQHGTVMVGVLVNPRPIT